MKLRISHVTEYTYDTPVTDSVNEVRLSPCTNERQSCYQHGIFVEPNASLFSYEDYFGNRVHSFSVNTPHRKLTIRTNMTVVTSGAAVPGSHSAPSFPSKAAWQWLHKDEAQDRFAEYLLETTYTTSTAGVMDFAGEDPAAQDDPPTVLAWLEALSTRIREEFVYDPEATTVQTTVSDMIGTRRGVCQDFAHLMITICRARQVPARYVSGYHFIGDLQGGRSDFRHASHAWVEAYVPGQGWHCFDPTNVDPVGERYVKLSHGRDYKDIVPVKGVYMGASGQRLHVSVDVENLDE
ncbi:transglutaminase family protein [Paenibacillus sp. IB182496]|uniref:Transglutaminase family protein n=1 Tax=Paenibacillus sabuli TaxID=2772509 RepID=A0A927BS47_9BACL|nr:transglutaminase family protein [Paenibacillus sabuli]MBD2845773.1 transglutaminase family protein [Paenibacillus sabuli]